MGQPNIPCVGTTRQLPQPNHSHSHSSLEASRSSWRAGMVVNALILVLLLLLAPFGAVSQSDGPMTTGPIIINELLSSPPSDASSLVGASLTWPLLTNATKWFELLNTGSSEVDLSWWTVTRGPQGSADEGGSDAWKFPEGVKVPAGGFLVVLCPSRNDAFPAIPAGATNVVVATGFKVERDGLFLYGSGGKLVAATGELPRQRPGVTFGLPQPPVNTSGSGAAASPYTYMAAPTPWLPNSGGLAAIGPNINSLKRKPDGTTPAGKDLAITAEVTPNLAPIESVVLVYRVNFNPEQQLAMTAQGEADSGGYVSYSATIPATQFKAGDMVRWLVRASDTAGGVSSEPLGLKEGHPQYKGTVIPVAAEASSPIPVLYWFAENAAAAQTEAGAPSSLAFNGSFYDNVEASRRGVTSLSWTKPKMNFKVPDGFSILPGVPDVEELKLNSYFVELGEHSFIREVVAYQVMAEEGVLAPLSYHVSVHLNGQFYGLFGIVEEVDQSLLERLGLPKYGPMFKSESGELSNLRWDLPGHEMPYYYSKSNRKDVAADWQLLANFTRGLAGGGPGTRTSFLYDSLDLPAVVNEAAVQTLLNNMDRCTKNFYMYYNPDTAQWARIAWDIEASMGQETGLGGVPGDLYCILACEQWNSPLYCDSEHPQDMGNVQTPWGAITAIGMNPFQGAAVRSSGRRLAQAAAAAAPASPQAAAPLPAEGNKPLTFPQPKGWDNPDRVEYGTASISGAAGTYNHLTDALLDVASTRAMYMRRLRTLADKYYGQGRLRQIIDATRAKIESVAAQDNVLWQRGDGSRGYQQLTTEFIPIRSKQLLQTYAPGGTRPLLPGPQDNRDVIIGFGRQDLSSPAQQVFMSLVLKEPRGEAVDVGRWQLTREGAASWSFPPGTVLPPNATLYLSPDVTGFRGRSVSPKAGEAVFVLRVPEQLLPQPGSSSSYTLVDDRGAGMRLVA